MEEGSNMETSGKVTIELDESWVRVVNSPLMWLVAALQGLAISFAPLFIFFCGQGVFPRNIEWIVVAVSYAIILFVMMFYFRLGAHVVGALRRCNRK